MRGGHHGTRIGRVSARSQPESREPPPVRGGRAEGILGKIHDPGTRGDGSMEEGMGEVHHDDDESPPAESAGRAPIYTNPPSSNTSRRP
jgi:hypothetical protein